MLTRFCLYGFLKNQQYFEPVFYLILLHEKGLSYTMLGALVGFGGICVNILEVPSGALADLYGRKKCMIISFSSYILSFLLYSFVSIVWMLFVAMFLFSIGEAFRTGTHKAMIFDWLRSQGRLKEKTRIYGFTRSWSKIGSSVSAVIGLVFMLSWRAYNPNAEYSHIFLLCILPYFIGIINFLGYPKELGRELKNVSLIDIVQHLFLTLKDAVKIPELKRLFIESMSFEGIFKTIKDYIQPIANQMVLGIPIFLAFTDKDQKTTIVVYSIYFVLSIFASFASRYSYIISKKSGGEDSGCRVIWWTTLVLFCAMAPLLYFELYIFAIVTFICFHMLQNFWRPMLLSRFDAHSKPETSATILSLESQAKSLFTVLAAPLIGFMIDHGPGVFHGASFCSLCIYCFFPKGPGGVQRPSG
ncbi:MAG: MFS transporter [Spirochaetota bacterium]|nr:MFS transporter [Spirochaetota bacterium]